MADKKISQLSAATTPLAGTEVLPIVQSGSTVKVSVADLTAARAVSASQLTIANNTSSNAVTITQTGSGNALVVEDSASPDATPFMVTGAGDVYANATTFGTATTTGFRVNSDGRIANGSAADGVLTLSYTGGNAVGTIVAIYRGASLGGSITTDGSSTGYNTSSDVRMKKNIVDAPDASELIDQIKVRSFVWKATDKAQAYGFIAQELMQIAPDAVYQPLNPDEMMAVDYSKLVPLLVKEIQSLRARVTALDGK